MIYSVIQISFYIFTKESFKIGCHADRIFEIHKKKISEIKNKKYDPFVYKYVVAINIDKKEYILKSIESLKGLKLDYFDLFAFHTCSNKENKTVSLIAYENQLNQLDTELDFNISHLNQNKQYIIYKSDLKILCHLEKIIKDYERINTVIERNIDGRSTASKIDDKSERFKDDLKQLMDKYDRSKNQISKKWDINISSNCSY